MPASLSEMVLGWETHFQLVAFLDTPADYLRTFRAWALAHRSRRRAADTAGRSRGQRRRFARYFAAGEVCFRLREHALYRVVLAKRPQPKRWAVPVRPSDVPDDARGRRAAPRRTPSGPTTTCPTSSTRPGSGPSMMYTSGLWGRRRDPPDLEPALDRKIDFFAERVAAAARRRVLDVGCGWGGTLRRLVQHGTGSPAPSASR